MSLDKNRSCSIASAATVPCVMVTLSSTPVALNFAQYIDWGAYQCHSYEELPQAVLDFIKKVEDVTGVPVKLIGTGPNNDDIIDIR